MLKETREEETHALTLLDEVIETQLNESEDTAIFN